MKVFLSITGELGDLWATPEQLQSMSDQQIIELVKEDVSAFYEDASWEVSREVDADAALTLPRSCVVLAPEQVEEIKKMVY